MDHVKGRGQSAGVQREAALCSEGITGYGANYESRELRQQSQREVRLRDDWRGKRSKGVPKRRDTGISCDDSGRRTSPWNLAVGRWLASLCRIRKRRTLRSNRYSCQQGHRQYSNRTNDAGFGLCFECRAERCWHGKSDAARRCCEYSTAAVGTGRDCVARGSGIGGREFTRSIGSCSGRGESACSPYSISGLSGGIQSIAIRQTRTPRSSENKYRWRRHRSSNWTAEGAGRQ